MIAKDVETRYYEFLKTHRDSISYELQDKYRDICSKFHFDFGGKVCIPLFVVWAFFLFLMPRPVSNLVLAVTSIIFVAFAFWLKRFVDSIVGTVCSCLFEKYEYESIVLRYVHRCKNGTLRDAASENEINNIERFFEYCEAHIVEERFPYTQ